MRKFCNAQFAGWRMDEDGILRVTAHVLKEGVFPYNAAESDPALAHNGVVLEYIPKDEFTPDALKTLEGRDVTIPVPGKEHEWRTPDVAREDGLSVGAIAGAPFVTADGKIQCDFLISDADVIRAITAGELVEVSAGYLGTMDPTPGVWDGQPYDAIQRDLRFNHILLLPPGAGRCGPDVRIINRKGGIMPYIVERRIGNAKTPSRYSFTNAEDKAEAERMNEDAERVNEAEKADLGARLNEALAGRDELQAQVNKLNEDLAAKDADLTAIKDELEKALSPEAAEVVAEAIAEQNADEESIIAAELPEDKELADEVKNRRGNCASLAGRRSRIVNALAKKSGLDSAGWSADKIDGFFGAAAIRARANTGTRHAMGGASAQRTNSGPADAKARMMAPWGGK